jgi:hypothetical protein
MANETAFSYQAPDELVYNLLTGRGGRLGLLPSVEAYYRSQLEQLGGADTSPFTYTGQRIAGFSPREELAMQLADQGIGSFAPFLARSAGLTEEALATLAGGTSEAKSQLLRALQQGEDYTKLGIGQGTEFLGAGVDKASEAEQGLINALAGVRGRGETGYQSGLADILTGVEQGRTGLDQASPFFTQARARGLDAATEAERLAREAQTRTDPFLDEALTGVRTGRASELTSVADAKTAAQRARDLQSPFISEALSGVRAGQREELAGAAAAEAAAQRARDLQSPFIEEALAGTRTGVDALLGRTGEAAQIARGVAGTQDPFIDEASQLARASTAGFDVGDIDRYVNPFEDQVVQQTIKDLRKAQAQSDIARAATEISSGAFGGSRSRLGTQEAQIAAERGLAEALAGIRAGGFESARGAAMSEAGRQRAAEAGAAGTIAGLGSQRAATQTGLASMLSQLGGQEAGTITGAASQIAGLGGQRAGAESQLAQTLAGLGAQRGAARRGSAAEIAGLGGQRAGAESQLAQTLAGLGAQRGAAQRGAASEIAALGTQKGSGLERLASTIANLGAQRAGFETGAGTALSNLAQQRFNIGTGAGAQQAALAGQSAAQQLAAAQAGQAAKQATAATLGQAGQQIYGMGTGAGQQLFGMGTGAGQQLSGLAGQLAAGQQQGAQAMSQQAQLRPQLQAGDVSSLMQTGAMNRARNQALLDLNYQNFVGQYNLPNQLMSGFANFLTGAGPLAGGTGYSGTAQQTPFSGAPTYSTYAGYGMKEGGRPIPEGNKGLVALAKKAPEVVRKMGFTPAKKNMGGGISSRFPRASRKLGA